MPIYVYIFETTKRLSGIMRIVQVYNEDVVIETNSSRRVRAKSIQPELKLVGYHSMADDIKALCIVFSYQTEDLSIQSSAFCWWTVIDEDKN
ncbi:hypothetical protein M0804_006229 [Polistes exclamans]|nr:hypothetical protein M0804_006229 [Polistes exclamans]